MDFNKREEMHISKRIYSARAEAADGLISPEVEKELVDMWMFELAMVNHSIKDDKKRETNGL